MRCEEVRKKLEDYLNGTCTNEEERAIEEHLQTCEECEWEMEEHINQKKISAKDWNVPELSYIEQRKIVRKAKWKNRLSTAFTVFGLFFIISIGSAIVTGLYYKNTGLTANRVIQTAIQMTLPNVYSDGAGTSTNFYFNADIQGDLQKSVGSEERYIGKYHGKMILNYLNGISKEWVDGRYDLSLIFHYPLGFLNGAYEENLEVYRLGDETWEALNKLPEGTVSEIAVSLDGVYTFDEVKGLFKDYDIDIVWYAIDTGTARDNDTIDVSIGEDLWGIHEYAWYKLLGDNVADKATKEDAFKKGLAFLAEHATWAKRVIWDFDQESIKEMLDYVDEHGVKCYGVVLTGPTKELAKLADNEHITYAALGEVDFWNWTGKQTGGALYN
jgi:hypothetical protein